jgi:hypothetical protein
MYESYYFKNPYIYYYDEYSVMNIFDKHSQSFNSHQEVIIMGFKSDLFMDLVNVMGEAATLASKPTLSSSEISVLRSAAEIMEKNGRSSSEIRRLIDECNADIVGSSRSRVGRGPRTTYDTKMDLECALRRDDHFIDCGEYFKVKAGDYTWYVRVLSDTVRIEKDYFYFRTSTVRNGGYYKFDGTSITDNGENTRYMSNREISSFKTVQAYIYQILREI